MSSDQMKINIDWDKRERKGISNEKKVPEKPKSIKQISSKSKTSKTPEKIGAEFIDSFKWTLTPGKIFIEIGYSLDNQDEDKQGIHVKTVNMAQIQELKRFLDIF